MGTELFEVEYNIHKEISPIIHIMLVLITYHVLFTSTGRGTNMSILHSWKINFMLKIEEGDVTIRRNLGVALHLRKCA